jgi:putative tape measure domain protein|nr:MAG TPA: tail tape measure protein [Caudoviricetes sp.]
MLGGAEAARRMLQDLSDFAANTPFELTGVRETAKQLLAYNIEAHKIIPTLKALGDVSAGLSVPIQQVAFAYGQVKSAGRLLGQDLRQFTNAGVPIIAELAKNLGVAESKIKDMVSAGKI